MGSGAPQQNVASSGMGENQERQPHHLGIRRISRSEDQGHRVIAIHEIFGMTDWVQSLADEMAEAGYIAIAPDLLSGMGPNGGGTDSLEASKVGQVIRD